MSGDRIRLQVEERDAAQRGSRVSRRLRRDGLIPGVLYGKGHTRAIAVPERDLRAALTGPSGLHAILDVVIEGQKTEHHAVLKDYQQHVIRGTITHVDFHEVRLDQPIQASVAIQLVGEAPGSKLGGVVQQVTREVNVEALPTAIPEHLEADLSGLDVGDILRLEDVPPIEGVTFLDDPRETVLATCSMPRGISTLEEEEEVEGEEAEGEGEPGEPPEASSDQSGEPPAEG
ncbi:MAG TPA: 50S ribosomal protein L25 [Gaiellaceae bacterium]